MKHMTHVHASLLLSDCIFFSNKIGFNSFKSNTHELRDTICANETKNGMFILRDTFCFEICSRISGGFQLISMVEFVLPSRDQIFESTKVFQRIELLLDETL